MSRLHSLGESPHSPERFRRDGLEVIGSKLIVSDGDQSGQRVLSVDEVRLAGHAVVMVAVVVAGGRRQTVDNKSIPFVQGRARWMSVQRQTTMTETVSGACQMDNMYPLRSKFTHVDPPRVRL